MKRMNKVGPHQELSSLPLSSTQPQKRRQQHYTKNQHQNQDPMFQFSNIMNNTPSTLNESTNGTLVCPSLTISNLTSVGDDGTAFSIHSGSTSTSASSSNGSARSQLSQHNGESNSGVDHKANIDISSGQAQGLGGLVRSDYTMNSNISANGSSNIMMRPAYQTSSKRDSMRWLPAESPDPLSATARALHMSGNSPPNSPPSPPMRGPHHYHFQSGEDIDCAEKEDISKEVECLATSPKFIPSMKSRSSASDEQSQKSSSSIYLPVRHHHNHPRQSSVASSTASPSLTNVAVPTKKSSPAPSRSSSTTDYGKSPPRPAHKKLSLRRSSFSQPLYPLDATIVFVDLEGYSKSSDVHQRQLTCDFMNTLRNLLTFAYDEMPVRGNIDNYVILPTGDGAAVIVIQPPRRVISKGQKLSESIRCSDSNECSGSDKTKDKANHQLPHGITCEHCKSNSSLRTTEETALWIGSSLLLWASLRHIGLRVGLNSGELSIVEDPYGDPNVCGDAINMAARIMDTALPGQILASASTVVPNLNVLAAEDLARTDMLGAYYEDKQQQQQLNLRREQESCIHCPRIKYEIADQASEVVVKHGVTTNVQSITCQLHLLPRPEDLPPELQPVDLLQAIADATASASSPGGQPKESHAIMARRRTAPSGCVDVPQPIHPLARMKQNPAKQSFASLSSHQPNASNNSLRGSLKRGSTKDSSPTASSSSTRRNSSWKLGESFTEKSGPPQSCSQSLLTRMSMLSQLSCDDNHHHPITSSSTRTLPTSNQQEEQAASTAIVPQHVGNHRTPATKWYMKIKPTEMQESSEDKQIKPKVLPQELIRRHKRIAFLGIMHDNLSRGFIKILENDPDHRWEQVYVLFPSDSCLKNHLRMNYKDQPVEKLILNKRQCCRTLTKLLSPVVDDLRFLQYDQLMHCGSYWDWKDPGGFIHISPLTWGANPKTCPAMNYYWNSRVPSPEYRVYREGLEYLLGKATPFDKEEEISSKSSLEGVVIDDNRTQ